MRQVAHVAWHGMDTAWDGLMQAIAGRQAGGLQCGMLWHTILYFQALKLRP